jgi:glycosyltransferase involved in cell wall biosynthesis
MNDYLVSIVIPCYNQGIFIDDALNSVFKQTYNHWEIIIINDGSSDDFTNRKLSAISHSKIQVLHTDNQGLAQARNNGIAAASGELILALDADNYIVSDYLYKTVNVFKSNRSLDIVYSDAFYCGAKTGIWYQGDLEFPLFLTRNLIDACAIFKKEVWIKNNGYNPNMKYGWEDWNFWLQSFQKKCKFFHLKEPLFNYRVSLTSMVHEIAEQTSRRHYLEQQIVVNNLTLYNQYFPEPLSILRELFWLRDEKKNFELVKNQIYNSLSYKIGNFILQPMKILFKNKFQFIALVQSVILEYIY